MSKEVKAIKQVLLAKNFDIASIVSMDKSTWAMLSLKAGNFKQTIHCARQFVGKLKESCAMQAVNAVDAVDEVSDSFEE